MLSTLYKQLRKEHIVLASQSPQRINIMKSIPLDFISYPSDYDESLVPVSDDYSEYVMTLAEKKGEKVLNDVTEKKLKATLIIAADTVVVKDGEVIGKPQNRAHAFDLLNKLAGGNHYVYTGVYLVRLLGEDNILINKKFFDMTTVTMGNLNKETIDKYLELDEYKDKAGAYAIQGIAGSFVSGIVGDYYNVVGLPKYKLCCNILDIFKD